MPIDFKLECYLNMNIHHHDQELFNYFFLEYVGDGPFVWNSHTDSSLKVK